MRGGSWNNSADNARCAYSNRNHPDNRNNNLGFLANFTRRLERNIDAYRAGSITFVSVRPRPS